MGLLSRQLESGRRLGLVAHRMGLIARYREDSQTRTDSKHAQLQILDQFTRLWDLTKIGDRLLFPQFRDGKSVKANRRRNWGKSSLSPIFQK
jgi:hypothetical protein